MLFRHPIELIEYAKQVSPLSIVVILVGVFCIYAWFASLITGDTSQVDRLWSVVPVIYMWVFVITAHQSKSRLLMMAILVTAWGVRPTFNFARKGGYTGVEDYRWAILRSRMKKWQFQLFNLFFIVLYQNFILVLITLPALMAYNNQGKQLSIVDWVLAIVFLAFLFGEYVADQQQWDFHQEKKAIERSGGIPAQGFLQSGLFNVSRHPNYFFEQAQWWVVYIFGAYSVSKILDWPIIGAVLLTLLFIGSTRFTETISRSKYPEYAEYQKRVSAVIPWFRRN